jgi:hypothetical protein
MLGIFPLGASALGQLPFVKPPIGNIGWAPNPARRRRRKEEAQHTFDRKQFEEIMAAEAAAQAIQFEADDEEDMANLLL